jgi:uncharacterized membrane protein YphA (DoxX/SURF4 family)
MICTAFFHGEANHGMGTIDAVWAAGEQQPGTTRHPAGTCFSRSVLRYLRREQAVCRQPGEGNDETLVQAKVPFPRPMTYFVSSVEFLGGCLLVVGLLSSLASLALLVNMLVAILTTKLPDMPKGLSPLNWLDDFLYFPEVLYILFFIWLICSGPGKFSLDYWLAGKL